MIEKTFNFMIFCSLEFAWTNRTHQNTLIPSLKRIIRKKLKSMRWRSRDFAPDFREYLRRNEFFKFIYQKNAEWRGTNFFCFILSSYWFIIMTQSQIVLFCTIFSAIHQTSEIYTYMGKMNEIPLNHPPRESEIGFSSISRKFYRTKEIIHSKLQLFL